WLGCGAHDLHDTWALSLTGEGLEWSRIDSAATGFVGSVLADPSRNRVLAISPAMEVSELPLDRPGGWRVLSVAGDVPPPRPLPGWTLDAKQDRILLFGGGSTADVYALKLLTSP